MAQVTEWWTQFGGLDEIWLDGGCGSMCDKVGALVTKLQTAALWMPVGEKMLNQTL